MLLTMPPKKRPVGRPKADEETDSISGRVPIDQKKAIEVIAEVHRRTTSAELGVAVEKYIIAHRELLEDHGAWPLSLDRRLPMKAPKPDSDA